MLIVLTTRSRYRLTGPGAVGQVAVIAHRVPSQPLLVVDTKTRAGAVVHDRTVTVAWDTPALPFTEPSPDLPDWIRNLRTALTNLTRLDPTT